MTAVILTAFLTLQLSPAVAAARQGVYSQQGGSIQTDRLNETLLDLKSALADMQTGLQKGTLPAKALGKVTALKSRLIEADILVMADFEREAGHMRLNKLSDAIQQRQSAAVAAYRDRHEQMLVQLDALLAANGSALGGSVAKTLTLLSKMSLEPDHQAFDPKNLPFRVGRPEVRQPKTTPQELQGLFIRNLQSRDRDMVLPLPARSARASIGEVTSSLEHYRALVRQSEMTSEVAAIGPMWGLLAVAVTTPPGPEYLAANDEVRITQPIRDLAAELHNNPVEIHNWVRNNIDFLPTYGLVQNSETTLQSRRGNAYDIATLAIALLRAANIPARYAYGTIQVPVDKGLNWFGGLGTAEAAANLLAQGGIPNILGISGGRPILIKLEHVWVEAFVDFYPSRGARNIAPDTWVPIDPSFKQFVEVPSQVTSDVIGDVATVAQNYAQSGSAAGASATGFDNTILANAAQAVTDRLVTKLGDSEYFFGDLLGTRSIQSLEVPVLPASLPYRLVAVGNRFAALPVSLKPTITLELFLQSDLGDPEASPVLSQSVPLASLGFSSFELEHVPATEADAETWDSYTAQGRENFPPYQVHVKSSLKLAGTVLATGPSLPVGERLLLRAAFSGPGDPRRAQFKLLSGDQIQVGVNPGGYTTGQGVDLLQSDDLDTAVGNLNAAAKSLWIQQDYWDAVLARLNNVVAVRLPSVGLFSAPVTVDYRYGVPYTATYHTHRVDIQLAQLAAVAKDGSAEIAKRFLLQSGMTFSSMEGIVLEEIFSKPLGYGSNAARLLELANQQSIPIYHLTANNYAANAGSLSHSSMVMADISNAINAGMEVIVPKHTQTNNGWTGSGYLLLDPVTGSGAYLVSGGFNGNEQTDCGFATVPVKAVVPDVSILALLAFSFLLDDDNNLNPAPAAAQGAQAALASALLLAGGAAFGIAARVGGRFMLGTTLLGAGLTAYASDGCSCEPQLITPRRGGTSFFTARHNACADQPEYTDFPGSDVQVEVKAFDGLKETGRKLYEIKTGVFYSVLNGRTSVGAKRIQDLILMKNLAEFAVERGIATACEFEFGFGARDAVLVTDMQARLAQAGDLPDAARVFVNSCP